MIAQQHEALDRLVQTTERFFQDKQAATARRDWCNPIPAEHKVDTVQAFLNAFDDEATMEIATCTVCYMKKKPQDLGHVDWRRAIPANIRPAIRGREAGLNVELQPTMCLFVNWNPNKAGMVQRSPPNHTTLR
jgi:hypothetical protein